MSSAVFSHELRYYRQIKETEVPQGGRWYTDPMDEGQGVAARLEELIPPNKMVPSPAYLRLVTSQEPPSYWKKLGTYPNPLGEATHGLHKGKCQHCRNETKVTTYRLAWVDQEVDLCQVCEG